MLLPLKSSVSRCVSKHRTKYSGHCSHSLIGNSVSNNPLGQHYLLLTPKQSCNLSCKLHSTTPARNTFVVSSPSKDEVEDFVIRKESLSTIIKTLGGDETKFGIEEGSQPDFNDVAVSTAFTVRALPDDIKNRAIWGFRLLSGLQAALALAMASTALGAVPAGWLGFLVPGPRGLTTRLLLGLAAAGPLRAAATLFHLQAVAAADQLVSWKHQRLSAALALFGAAAAISQLPCSTTMGLLAPLIIFSGAATAACCGWVAAEQHKVQPFVSPYLHSLPAAERWSAVGRLLLMDMQSLASCLSLATAGLALTAFVRVLLTPSAGMLPPTGSGLLTVRYAYPAPAAGLRRLAMCSMPLLAGQVLLLLDLARLNVRRSNVREFEAKVIRRLCLPSPLTGLTLRSQPAAYYAVLIGGVAAAAALQAVFLWTAATSPAVLLDADPVFWGGLLSTTALSLLYALVVLPLRLGFHHVVAGAAAVLDLVYGFSTWLLGHLVINFRWIEFFRHTRPL